MKSNKQQVTYPPERLKMAKRLAYLLKLRDEDPRSYRDMGGGEEKESFYVLHPEIVPLAIQIYNGSLKL